MTIGSLCSRFSTAVLEYETPKIVHIKSKKVGILNRFIQLLIVGYIIGYVIIYKKGYQEISPIQSGITSKVKGVIWTNFSSDAFKPGISNESMYNRIWDIADYVVPPDMNDAFFVTTNLIITPQNRGICNENAYNVPAALCYGPTNHSCNLGKPFLTGNGVQTGECTEASSYLSNSGYSCQIHAWCEVELDTEPLKDKHSAILEKSAEFTVFIKNTIVFTKFNIMRRNVADHSNTSYLRGCLYDKENHPLCPIFCIGDIVKIAYEGSNENYSSIAVK